jgi:hypothetical protein
LVSPSNSGESTDFTPQEPKRQQVVESRKLDDVPMKTEGESRMSKEDDKKLRAK